MKKIIDIFPPEKQEKLPEKRKIVKSKPRLSAGWAKIFFRESLNLKKISLFGVSFFVILGMAAFFTLGKAEILIWPKTETLNFDTKIKIGQGAGDGVVQGEVFSTEKTVSKEFSVQGKQLIEKKAEGVIRVYNNSSKSQTLILNTRFQASLDKFQPALEGKEQPWFRSLGRVIVPPKSYKDIRVAADSAGEKYNIKPSKFSIPGLAGTGQYTLVYGESLEDFKGGLKKETAKVSTSDINEAKSAVLRLAKEEILEDLKNRIPADFIFLEDGAKVEISQEPSSVKLGELAEKFIYQARALSKIAAFKKADLEKFITDFFSARIPNGKEMDEKSLSYEYSLYSLDPESDEMTVFLKIKAKIFTSLDEKNIKERLSDKSLAESNDFLANQPELEKVKVKLWPFWQKRVPKAIQKIKLDIRLD